MTASMFHDGERAVQRRAGTERFAAQVGRHLSSVLRDDYAAFIADQPFLVVAAQDTDGRVWASLLAGGVGFARALDERQLHLAARLPGDDPLHTVLTTAGTKVGLLALEPDSRSRVRVNGTTRPAADGILLAVEEAFGNCPKYIQWRVAATPIHSSPATARSDAAVLDTDQAGLIQHADTFFIASVHPERGADASHRGGRPGFVEVARGGRTIRFPDYTGNRMFQTLGNLTVDPRVGLLFLDWTSGTALQVTGTAAIVWDDGEIGRYPGAERIVDVAIQTVHQQDGTMPVAWELVEAWPHQPALP